jgi:hypothetical protein
MSVQIVFINNENKVKYSKEVLTYLESDFHKRVAPSRHFWYNKDTIADAFENCTAMIVLNDSKQVIGYMIWHIHESRAEIVIVEVRENYRRQGICRKMLEEFCNKFCDIYLLTASPIPQSKEIFKKTGWGSVLDPNNREKFFKIVKSALQPLDTLPIGRVIAVCPEDYYQVLTTLKKGENLRHPMQYFQIDVLENEKLREPIIIPGFYYENYIGVYFNQKLIDQGKAKHLFKNQKIFDNFLVISSITPINPEPFYSVDFFPKSHEEAKDEKQLSQPDSKIDSAIEITSQATVMPVATQLSASLTRTWTDTTSTMPVDPNGMEESSMRRVLTKK